jgi:RimJ/RimL family protein N-acetyltransferase
MANQAFKAEWRQSCSALSPDLALVVSLAPDRTSMGADSDHLAANNWRDELPVLAVRGVSLREPVLQDLGPLVDLLSIADASRFGLEYPITDLAVSDFIARGQSARAAGQAFTYVVMTSGSRVPVGLVQVRGLDPAFEAAEWEATLAPSVRGTGAFLDVARLVGSFAFSIVGAHRLEARTPLQNGRANGALRKLGAVQEGVLRRSVRRGDEYLDQVLWSILKEDWSEHWVSTAPRVH